MESIIDDGQRNVLGFFVARDYSVLPWRSIHQDTSTALMAKKMIQDCHELLTSRAMERATAMRMLTLPNSIFPLPSPIGGQMNWPNVFGHLNRAL